MYSDANVLTRTRFVLNISHKTDQLKKLKVKEDICRTESVSVTLLLVYT